MKKKKRKKKETYSAIFENIIGDANIDFTKYKIMKFEANFI